MWHVPHSKFSCMLQVITSKCVLVILQSVFIFHSHTDKAECNSHHENGKTMLVVQPTFYRGKFYY